MIKTIVPKIKICCISSEREAKIAIDAGASVLGLVGKMPSGPGIITDELAAKIARQVPEHIETFLLTSETTAAAIVKHHQRVNSTAIQIVDELVEGCYADIKSALPGIKLVQVIHVLDENSIEQAKQVAANVDAILLDSGNPHLVVKELGGTGRTHNWKLSQQIVSEVCVPVYLAGGLNTENVIDAISQVRPYGLDLCSSVRTEYHLDEVKLIEFIAKAKSSG
ncbi:MAG: phosphoribosylanthranilate isomerase [Marinicella sp.]